MKRNTYERLRLGFASLLTVTAINIVEVSAPNLAAAEIYQCGTNEIFFDGIGANGPTSPAIGAYAVVTSHRGSLCDTNMDSNQYHSTTFTCEWAMIASQNNPGYIQSGSISFYNRPMTFFAEDNATGGNNTYHRFIGPATSEGQTDRFIEQYSASDGYTREMIDVTNLQTSTFQPTVAWGYYSMRPIFLGETHYQESDMPGSASTPSDFSQLQTQNFYSLQFEPSSGPYQTYGDYGLHRYHTQVYDNQHFKIWTA